MDGEITREPLAQTKVSLDDARRRQELMLRMIADGTCSTSFFRSRSNLFDLFVTTLSVASLGNVRGEATENGRRS